MNRSIYIGIDGGGTKTELLATRAEGDEVIRRVGDRSNLQLVGLDETVGVISDLVHEAVSALDGGRVARLCVGLSGAGRSHEQEAVLEALAAALDLRESSVQVVSDAEIAVEAAFPGASGVLVIAGTGSMACGRTTNGTFACAGGWGRLLGDEGSGYAIGRAGLQAVAAAVDGGPETALVDRVRDLFGGVSKAILVRHVYGEEWPIQEFAPHVFAAAEAEDTEARRILREQTRMLARRVMWLARRYPGSFDRRIVLTGGLSKSEVYRAAFKRAIRRRLTGWEVERRSIDPARGALQMALAGR